MCAPHFTLHIPFHIMLTGCSEISNTNPYDIFPKKSIQIETDTVDKCGTQRGKEETTSPTLGDEIETNPSSFHIQTQIQIFIVIQIQLFLCTFVLLHCYKYCFYPFYPSNLMKTHKKLLPHFSHWDSYQELLTQQNPKWDPWEPM